MPDKPKEDAVEVLPWEQLGKRVERKRAGIVVDLRRCIGCHACSVACKTEHDVALGVFRTRVRYLEQPGRHQLAFLPLLCMHCQDAPCIPTCPHEAVRRDDDGRVVIDENACEGDRCCIDACPYGAIGIDPQSGIADKCACVNVCPTAVLRFGDLDDPADPVYQLAREQGARAMKEDAGTRPSVLYLGLETWMEEKASGGIQLTEGEDELVYVQARKERGR